MPLLDIAKDPLTCKTYLSCCYNSIPFDKKHKVSIKQVDDYMNRPSITHLLASCGNFNKAHYHFNTGDKEWYYIMQFKDENITATASKSSLVIIQGE